jgi:NADH:ubiquinone oxidoreductase subunit E
MTVEIAEAELESMRAAVDALPRRRDQLLPALLAAGHDLGWLPEPAIEHVAAHVRVPLSEVYATATAYSELRLEPAVAGRWGVCTGVACREAGADALLAALGDRAVEVDCRFACALAPIAEDDRGALLGRCTAERLHERAAAGTPR